MPCFSVPKISISIKSIYSNYVIQLVIELGEIILEDVRSLRRCASEVNS